MNVVYFFSVEVLLVFYVIVDFSKKIKNKNLVERVLDNVVIFIRY